MTKGIYIKEVRSMMNVSQRRLAQYLGKTQQWVAQVENKAFIDDSTAKKITNAINELTYASIPGNKTIIR